MRSVRQRSCSVWRSQPCLLYTSLGRRDNALAEQAALCDYIFLQRGKLSEGDFDAEVAAAYHYPVALFTYIFDVVYSRAVLDFCDYVYACLLYTSRCV